MTSNNTITIRGEPKYDMLTRIVQIRYVLFCFVLLLAIASKHEIRLAAVLNNKYGIFQTHKQK